MYSNFVARCGVSGGGGGGGKLTRAFFSTAARETIEREKKKIEENEQVHKRLPGRLAEHSIMEVVKL
jgi:hypothetical protein